MEARRRRRFNFWERSDVPCCVCSSLSYKHTHCPCEQCHGDAVSRSTEFRHWLAAKREFQDNVNASTSDSASCSTDVRNLAQTPTLLTSPSHTVGAIENPNDGPEEDSAHARLLDTEVDRESGCTGSSSATVSARDTVTNDIVWSILEGMQMMEEANTSQQDFLQMMRFGKHLYKRGVSIAGLESSTELMEIVDSLWPDTWQEALKMMKKAGYEPPKALYVCLNDSHVCLWDVLEEGQKCRHCGESGKIPYYYLSLSDKVW